MTIIPVASVKNSSQQYANECSSKTSNPQANHGPQSRQKSSSIASGKSSTKSHILRSGAQNYTTTSTSNQGTIGSQSLSNYHIQRYSHCGRQQIDNSTAVTQSNTSQADQDQLLLHVGDQFQDIPPVKVFTTPTSNVGNSGTSQKTDTMPMDRYLLQAIREGPWNAVDVDACMCEWEFVPIQERDEISEIDLEL